MLKFHNNYQSYMWYSHVTGPPINRQRHGISLRWWHNGRDGVSIHQPHDCLLNRLFRSRSKKTSKLRITGLCAGKSPGTGEFPAQMASNAENVSIWWRHHVFSRQKSKRFHHGNGIWFWPYRKPWLCVYFLTIGNPYEFSAKHSQDMIP